MAHRDRAYRRHQRQRRLQQLLHLAVRLLPDLDRDGTALGLLRTGRLQGGFLAVRGRPRTAGDVRLRQRGREGEHRRSVAEGLAELGPP